jgi:hypothetical protein
MAAKQAICAVAKTILVESTGGDDQCRDGKGCHQHRIEPDREGKCRDQHGGQGDDHRRNGQPNRLDAEVRDGMRVGLAGNGRHWQARVETHAARHCQREAGRGQCGHGRLDRCGIRLSGHWLACIHLFGRVLFGPIATGPALDAAWHNAVAGAVPLRDPGKRPAATSHATSGPAHTRKPSSCLFPLPACPSMMCGR